MPQIALASINIERSKHLDTVVSFLKSRPADVVTLQEVMERDIPLFESVIGPLVHYTPLCVFLARPSEQEGVYGQALFSKLPFSDVREVYYAGDHEPLCRFGEDKESNIAHIARALTSARFEKDGSNFRIATTHFTWSMGGEVTEAQKIDLQALLAHLADLREFVLTGDFNAPRGRATWDTLAAKYKDNIPAKYTSSIDPVLHRAAPLPYVVDGVFTTPHYVASDVELHTGISDHCAVTATISKV